MNDVPPAADPAAPPAAPPASPPPATPPAAPPATDPAQLSLLGAQPADKEVVAPANFPDNWRDLLNPDKDKAVENKLSRIASVSDLFKSYRALEQRLSEKGVKTDLPTNADAETLARWRTENGIPDSPDKYDTTLPDGLVIGDEDRSHVSGFLKAMHDKNVHPEIVKSALGWYFQNQENQIMTQASADAELKQKAEDTLRLEYGKDYRGNINAVADFLVSRFGKDLGSALHLARLPDGSIVGNNPDFVRSLVAMAREIDPGATIVPGASNQLVAIEDEIAQLNKLMRENREEYNKNPKYADRLALLMEAQAKMKPRAA